MKNIILWIVGQVLCRPRLTLVAVILLTTFFAVGLSRLRIETESETVFAESDPAQIAYRAFQKQFGRDDVLVLAVSSEEIFTGEFMNQLRAIHHDIEHEVPWLEDVTSLVNADYTDFTDDRLRVSRLGERWPKAGGVPASLKQDILSSPLYRGTLLAKDGKTTLIVVRSLAYLSPAALLNGGSSAELVKKSTSNSDEAFLLLHDTNTENGTKKAEGNAQRVKLPEEQVEQYLHAVLKVTDKYRAQGVDIRVAGTPLMEEAHHTVIHDDALLFIGLGFIVAFLVVALQFRSVMGVLIPFTIVFLSLFSIMGCMGWLGLPVTPVSQALPPLILAMGMMASVHMLSHYYQSKETSIDDAVKSIFSHAGVAVAATCLTDVAAFMSFTTARIDMIAKFGWMAAFGTLIGLVYTVLLLPALLKLVAPQRYHASRSRFMKKIADVMIPIADLSVRHPWKVLAVVLILTLAALPGLARLTFAHNELIWLTPTHPVRADTVDIDKKMQSTVPLEVILDTGTENGILRPDFMNKLHALQNEVKQLQIPGITIGSVTSIADSLERIHATLHAGNPASPLPQSENLLQQELLLYEGGGAKEIGKQVDRRYSKARLTIRLAWADAHRYVPLHDQVESKAKAIFGNTAQIMVTGSAYLDALGAIDSIDSMWSSYLLAIVLISIMILLLLRKVSVTIASLIPNFLPNLFALAVMGYIGIPVDIFTVLLDGIALGVAVDDTVHFMHTVMRHRESGNMPIREAVHETMNDVGPATVINAIVMACGFAVFAFSSIRPFANFGIVLSSVILLAVVLDVVVSPALITIIDRWQRKRARSTSPVTSIAA